jgi:hypothetical protein
MTATFMTPVFFRHKNGDNFFSFFFFFLHHNIVYSKSPVYNNLNGPGVNIWKNNFKKYLQCTLQTSHINENDKNKLELFRNNIQVFIIYEHKANAW